MMTLPPFQLHAPTSVEEALALLKQHAGDAKVIAGGTDLLPNMKRRLHTPGHLISLRAVPGLSSIRGDGEALVLGARCTLAMVAADSQVKERAPALAAAAGLAASPQLRNQATLGGNLCLDTRCQYFNQSHFWRKALGFCLKKDGDQCHVVPGGTRCVAANSADTVPVLIALGATVRIAGGADGPRVVDLAELYQQDGAHHLKLAPTELLLEVRVPTTARCAYEKLRLRQAIDFPLLGVAVAVEERSEVLSSVRVVLSALGPRPIQVRGLETLLGRRLDETVAQEAAALAHRQAHPQPNLAADPAWRRELVPVLVKRAFGRL